jgi:hypothetical protein
VDTRVSTGVTYSPGDSDQALHGGWQPLRVLGASSEFSLVLPDAHPTRSQVYAPRGVLLDPVAGGATRVIAADTGNHRLLVWPDLPRSNGADSAVVIGQPDAVSEGPQAGGRGPQRGLHLPTGLTRADDLLIVADGWNHRLVGYDAALDIDDPEPVWVLGQDDLSGVSENAGGDPTARSFYWPFGVLWHDGWLWVADTGNRRVLGWDGLPGRGAPADVVLGQPGAGVRDENRGGDVGPCTFRWPHAVAVTTDVLWVADAGNHRVLGWRLPLEADRPADYLLGQEAFTASREFPHVSQGPARLRFPYSVTVSAGGLMVADTANNRVLGWPAPPGPQADAVPVLGAGASAVLGQNGFDPGGENRWSAVTPDSLCWPYGLSAAADARHGEVLAIADSGNNRVVLWHRGP